MTLADAEALIPNKPTKPTPTARSMGEALVSWCFSYSREYGWGFGQLVTLYSRKAALIHAISNPGVAEGGPLRKSWVRPWNRLWSQNGHKQELL